MTRTERQKECIKKWLNNNGLGIAILPTGFGKTYMSIMLISLLIKKNPNVSVLVSVPTETIKKQWLKQIQQHHLENNCKVEIINTIIKHSCRVDLLIIDEIHTVLSNIFINIFKLVKYRYLLGLTGTLNRLDGREKLLEKYCSVIDTVSVEDAIINDWLSSYREYKVLLDVDLTEYNLLNQKFNSYFSFFDYNFKLAMNVATNIVTRRIFAKKMGYSEKQVMTIAMDWLRCMRQRNQFVRSHPKKFEITRKILNCRKDKKCITFSATISDTKKIGMGLTLHSQQSKVKNSKILQDFNTLTSGVINTAKSLDAGADIKHLSVAVILSGTSSSIQKRQRIGRIIRKEEGKIAEVFSLVIRNTQDEVWYNNASENYLTINEAQLDLILSGKTVNVRKRDDQRNFEYRF